ncbi:MAG: thiol:disulfide interchange protein DsbA/DsbL [Thiotrichales bacterium]|nr:thiol:disulfide interchange protein DsbA/DsbL [Thiotrichales bacterium]
MSLHKLLSPLVLLFFSVTACAEPWKVLDEAQPTDVAEGKIEVVEVFWYGCPHCYDFEPFLEDWLKNKPDDVEFKRMPGIFRENWVPHARAYYTALELGVLDSVHRPMFNAIHKHRKKLDSQSQLRKLFAENGIDEDAFDKVYESESVTSKVRKAMLMGRRYQIRGVPSVIVNGKYLTGASIAGNFENMLKAIDQLVDKERAQ